MVSRFGLTIRQIAGLFVVLLLPAGAVAMEDVEQARNLLKQMSAANRELDYRGIFTYEHAGVLKSMRIVHAVDEGLEYEKIVYLSGPRREIVRAGVSSRCRRFGEEVLTGPPMPSQYSAHLETHYDLFLKGEDRIADRAARVIHIVPKDSMRYGYILFLDRETGLLLQSLLVGPDRRILERFQFVDISYQLSEKEVAELMAAAEIEPEQTREACEETGQAAVAWQAKWLPEGFRLVNAGTGAAGETSMVYSDGLSFVSVFISAEGESEFPPLQAQRGATVAQMVRLNHNGETFLICVVGEVPPATVEQIAKFIAPQ